MNQDKINQLESDLINIIGQIRELYSDSIELTLIVRHPNHNGRDVILTSESEDNADDLRKRMDGFLSLTNES